VLPRLPDGQLPPVVAFARHDDRAPRDGSPVVFVVALYVWPAPAGGDLLFRIANSVRWTGERFAVLCQDCSGDVFQDRLREFRLASPTIGVESNQSEGNAVLTVRYSGQTRGGIDLAQELSYVEMYRPTALRLWQRWTEYTLQIRGPAFSGGSWVTSERASYAFVPAPGGREHLRVLVTETESGRLGDAPSAERRRTWVETYVPRSDSASAPYVLDSRVPQP
jgi:hypothetical protein